MNEIAVSNAIRILFVIVNIHEHTFGQDVGVSGRKIRLH